MRFLTIYFAFAFLGLFGSQGFAQQHQPQDQGTLSIAYVGNMGVLLAVGQDAVLVDGLHKRYRTEYAFPSQRTVSQIIGGQYQGFPLVDLVLVTHHHRDHFDADLSRQFLLQNEQARIAGPRQVIEKMPDTDDRTQTVDTEEETELIRKDQISVMAFNGVHVNAARHHDVQNIAYLVSLGEYTILHVGDAHWDVSAAQFEQAKLVDASIDVAIMPFWMLLEDSSIEQVRKYINPRHLVATHIPPDFAADMRKSLKRHFPNSVLLHDLDEVRQLK